MGITILKKKMGRHIVGYTFGNHVSSRTKLFDRISDDIPTQMKLLNTVIPQISVLMIEDQPKLTWGQQYWSLFSCIKLR